MLALARSLRAAISAKRARLSLNLDRLYTFTRESTADLRPWMCDEQGRAVVLDARYEFADLLIRREMRLEGSLLEATRYWQYITAPLSERPRDGGATWQYSNPGAQVLRFMLLINSLRTHGYQWNEQTLLDDFEAKTPPHIEIDAQGKESPVDYTGRQGAGFISVVKHGDFYSALNGLHRLAVLKYLRDHGSAIPAEIPVLRVG